MSKRARQVDRGRNRGVDPALAFRRQARAVLDAMGVRSLFEAMPHDLRTQVARDRGTEPLLVFDASFPADAGWRADLRALFREATFENDLGISMRVIDCYAVLPEMLAVIRGSCGIPGMPRSCERFFEAARPIVDDWLSRQNDAWDALHNAVIVPLTARGRMDERLFHASLDVDQKPAGVRRVRMTLHSTPPQCDRVTLDKVSRRIYRVGTSNEWNAVRWASWPAEILGRQGDDAPVYVQSHALRQLHARVNLPTYAPYLDYWLYASLREPLVVSREANGDLLVEYRVNDDRLGYLVVTPLVDRVVVRTFLFLTMSPSPEARTLDQKLRLGRGELNWLRLDELSAFTRTDLRDDPVLRPLLAACGCGHLFELDDADVAPRPLAADVRRHLRIAA